MDKPDNHAAGAIVGSMMNDLGLQRFHKRRIGEIGTTRYWPSHRFEANVKPVTAGDVFTMTRRFDLEAHAAVQTLYKPKSKKVQPVDMPHPGGEAPEGDPHWKDPIVAAERVWIARQARVLIDKWVHPRIARTAPGCRLTPERWDGIAASLPEDMREGEKALLHMLLERREMSMAWDFDEMGEILPQVAPPQRICTIDHKPWRMKGFNPPRSIQDTVVAMIKDRLKKGILEYCHGPYSNPWFLVRKLNGKYRLINNAQHINSVTLRDAMIPPQTEEFAEEFAGMQMISYLDFFSGYDQVKIATQDRDITAILTPLGLLRYTTLPQGGTNSVAQFQRIMYRILYDLIPNVARVYLDDIGVKGPKKNYENEEIPELPGVRRFVVEHLMNLDKVLLDIERAGATISGEKSRFCAVGVRIVGFVCDAEGRHPDEEKIAGIICWEVCRDAADVRSFVGMCVYYRIWIPSFAEIADPLYALLRKNVPFKWDQLEINAMAALKKALTEAPVLITIDYTNGMEIVLAVDASLRGWGAVLMQVCPKTGRRKPSRYLSGMWSKAEAAYDAGKRECRAVAKALKKLQSYLYGIHFVLELDPKTLISQVNSSASDVVGAHINRWLAWIHLFDFEIRHVPGKEHVVADALSRRPLSDGEELPVDDADGFDRLIDAEVYTVRAVCVQELGEVMSRVRIREASEAGEVNSPQMHAPNQRGSEGACFRAAGAMPRAETRCRSPLGGRNSSEVEVNLGFQLGAEASASAGDPHGARASDGMGHASDDMEDVSEASKDASAPGVTRMRDEKEIPPFGSMVRGIPAAVMPIQLYGQNIMQRVLRQNNPMTAVEAVPLLRPQPVKAPEPAPAASILPDDNVTEPMPKPPASLPAPPIVEGDGSETDEEPDGEVLLGEGRYSQESHQVALFLMTMRLPRSLSDLTREDKTKWKKNAMRFQVIDGHLYRRANKNIPLRRVIDSEVVRQAIMRVLHDDGNHKGREETYRRVANKYWWPKCFDYVSRYQKSCYACQKMDKRKEQEPLHPTSSAFIFQKVALDIVHMPVVGRGYQYLVLARDDLTGWVEGRALKTKSSQGVAKFLWEDVICRHSHINTLLVDGGKENKGFVTIICQRLRIRRVQAAAYHPQGNGMIERGHQPVVRALGKLTAMGLGDWMSNLAGVLWADRCSTSRKTGHTPYSLVYGYEPIVPLDEEVTTLQGREWMKVRETDELLMLRTLQLAQRNVALEEAVFRLQRVREEAKEWFDTHRRLKNPDQPIVVGDMVLLEHSEWKHDFSRIRKVSWKWRGPYRVVAADALRGNYQLAEADGSQLDGMISGERVKRYVSRADVGMDDQAEGEKGRLDPRTPDTLIERSRVDFDESALEAMGLREQNEFADELYVGIDGRQGGICRADRQNDTDDEGEEGETSEDEDLRDLAATVAKRLERAQVQQQHAQSTERVVDIGRQTIPDLVSASGACSRSGSTFDASSDRLATAMTGQRQKYNIARRSERISQRDRQDYRQARGKKRRRSTSRGRDIFEEGAGPVKKLKCIDLPPLPPDYRDYETLIGDPMDIAGGNEGLNW